MRPLAPYERLCQPMAPRQRFMRRMVVSSSIGLILIAISLLVGMVGYHWLVRLSWIDAYENAAMILSGMGPVAHRTAGRASFLPAATRCTLALLCWRPPPWCLPRWCTGSCTTCTATRTRSAERCGLCRYVDTGIIMSRRPPGAVVRAEGALSAPGPPQGQRRRALTAPQTPGGRWRRPLGAVGKIRRSWVVCRMASRRIEE